MLFSQSIQTDELIILCLRLYHLTQWVMLPSGHCWVCHDFTQPCSQFSATYWEIRYWYMKSTGAWPSEWLAVASLPYLKFGHSLPSHDKTLWLRNHWRMSSSLDCDGAQQWLGCWSYCRTQRWGQGCLALGPVCDILLDHRHFELLRMSSGRHLRKLWIKKCINMLIDVFMIFIITCAHC